MRSIHDRSTKKETENLSAVFRFSKTDKNTYLNFPHNTIIFVTTNIHTNLKRFFNQKVAK